MSNNKQIISLQISTELYNKLKETASDEDTNISAVIRRILISYYKEVSSNE